MIVNLCLSLLLLHSINAKVLLSEDILKNDENNLKEVVSSTKSHIIDITTPKSLANDQKEIKRKCEHTNDITGDLDSLCPEEPTKIDNGTALILTPYIERKQIEEARKTSKVDPKLLSGVESYSGYFTVNKTYNSNVFVWYFPVENKKVNDTPWIIWLQGGPGASSLTGLFEEIGPVRVTKFGTIKRNPYTWIQNHSVLFIDNPVGTGYSFTDHEDGYVSDMATYSKHLLSTVEQFLHVFPELRTAPLYIAGESYAGKYIPALGIELHKAKINSGLDINLQGFIIGNAYIDPSMIRNVHRPFYYFGLLNKEQLDSLEPLMKDFQADIDANNSVAAKNKWMQVVTVLLILSHQKQAYNFLKDELSVGAYPKILNTPEMKRGLHVGDIQFHFINTTVNTKMAPDFLSSSKELFEELLSNNYRVLSYCGQLDQLLPCVFSAENHRTWQWHGKEQFTNAQRYPFMFHNILAGYYKSGGNLTEVVVRGAGHMVPVDEPARAQFLVTNWIHRLPLATRFTLMEEFFLRSILNNSSALYF
ncbi:unnamed protein product [Leptosia nina]|uniref:Carboxypeptidase n=1 Tax=Leptosia nina TaxID=320188 RepID=A0AAV1J6W9_9NEOP